MRRLRMRTLRTATSSIAARTLEALTELLGAFLGHEHPWMQRPRWFVTHVLRVPALELRDPVAGFVLVEADHLPEHLSRIEQ
jgi:hypothetical protein